MEPCSKPPDIRRRRGDNVAIEGPVHFVPLSDRVTVDLFRTRRKCSGDLDIIDDGSF